ncbi:MAG: flagellin [Bryobacteraceae bacterium]|jgi:flagellin
MSISLQTNIDSLVGQQNLDATEAFQSTTIQQLTSGYRINSAADDAAGLAVANGFRSSEAELTQGVQNANNATSTLQIADGGMNNISQMLDTLRSLSTESASGTFTGDRTILNNEFQSLLTEVNQQSQAVGLNTGGQFATDLSVYIGGGKDTTTGGFSASNGTLNINLSAATVDTQSLGLTGFQAVGATQDLSAASDSSVSNIIGNAANTTAAAGYTSFDFSGPGFSDGSQAQVSVNLQGVTDINTLVTALNSAIATTGGGASASDTAFQSAGIIASVSTDANGGQELAFTSSNTAFQVQAGDTMANALLGNTTSATSSTGKSVASTTQGGTVTGLSGATFAPTGVNFEISGGGMTSPVTLSLAAGDTTVGAAITDLQTQVANNTALQAAGITVSSATTASAGAELVFTNSKGDTMNVQATGDTTNALGFGSYVSSSGSTTPTAANYTSITAGSAYALATNTGGTANLAVSFNGGASVSLASITLAGQSATSIADSINTGIAASATLQAAGLSASVNGSGDLVIASNNATAFRLSTASSTSGVTGDVGFGTTGVAAATGGQTASNAASTYVDAQGVSNSTAMSFSPILFGGGSQAITLAANSTDGTLESKTITLNNVNGQSIDSAVSVINQELQVSNNPTLQSIVAVKEDSSGTEKINFISSNSSFSVSVGASPNTDGISGTVGGNAVAGATTQSSALGTGTTVSIDTQQNAIQAVTALSAAVTKLGSAQAAVGTGENQLNYAIGLAQSQITNFTAAESRIRDADVAADAANLTKAQTLQQAGIAALSQANSEGQAVLHLLQ